MSRKGKVPIAVPKGVTVAIRDNAVCVEGPKGKLSQKLIPEIEVDIAQDVVTVRLAPGHEESKNFHGLYRTLIDNQVIGVTQGFKKELEMVGVGYRAAVKGRALDLQIGVSHPVLMPIPEGLEVSVEKNTTIVITGSCKQSVGQFAALVRAKRPPEPYQGKGIRYKGSHVRRKAGKSGGKK